MGIVKEEHNYLYRGLFVEKSLILNFPSLTVRISLSFLHRKGVFHCGGGGVLSSYKNKREGGQHTLLIPVSGGVCFCCFKE